MALFSCSSCTFSSNSALRQRIHNRGHSSASCRRCRRRFASAHGLLLHRKLGRCRQTKHSPPAMTEGRRNSTPDQQSLEKRAKELGSSEPTRGPPSLRCSKCSKKFAVKSSFYDHVTRSKSCGSRSEQYRCSNCDAAFASPHALRQHVASAKGCQRRLRAAQLRAALQTARSASPASLAATEGASVSTPHQQHHEKRTKQLGSTEPTRYPPSLRCSKCSKTFAMKSSFLDHTTRSKSCGSRSDQFKCPNCDAAFGVPKALVQHLASPVACGRRLSGAQTDAAATEAGTWKCAQCGAEFPTRRKHQDHASQSKSCGLNRARFSCSKCGFACAMAGELRAHHVSPKACLNRVREQKLRRRLGEGAYGRANSCLQCQQTYASWPKLQKHMRVSRTCGDLTSRYECTRCSAVFPMPNMLRLHMQREKACRRRARRAEILREAMGRDSDGNVACLRCKAPFANEALLLDHLTSRRRCSDKATAFVCGRCGYGFGYLHDLASHRRSDKACETNRKRTAVLEEVTAVTGELRCLRCRLLLPSATQLSVHMSPSGSCPSKAASVVCPTCQAPAPGLMELAAHRRTGKACQLRIRQHSLRARLPVALQLGGFLCPSCQKAFKQRDSLLSHMRISRSCGERADAWLCDDCGAAFREACQLSNHRQTGGGRACLVRLRQKSLQKRLGAALEKTDEFTCPSCKTKFQQRHSLFSHMRISRKCGDRADSCVCDDCGAAFAQPSQLAVHRRTGKACRTRLQRPATAHANHQLRQTTSAKPSPRKTSQDEHESLCAKCGKVFAARHQLLKHTAASRSCGDRAKWYACAECGQAFPYLLGLARHQRSPVACDMARKRKAVQDRAEVRVSDPAPGAKRKAASVLRCPSCAYMTTGAFAMGQHQTRPKACRFQSSRIQALCGSLASSACPNCGEEQGDARALMEHLAHGSECVKMRGFDEPVIPALERRLAEQ